MMSSGAGLSVHVVDIAQGVPAAGMRVDLFAIGPDGAFESVIAGGNLDPDGKISLDGEVFAQLIPCRFELRFHVAEYYGAGSADPALASFINVLPFRFGIAASDTHHHLPAKVTPWGLSLFLTK